jgi:hypothetical protein
VGPSAPVTDVWPERIKRGLVGADPHTGLNLRGREHVPDRFDED